MVKKKTLLFLAGSVWCIAGINICKIGIESYMQVTVTPLLLLSSVVIFGLFLGLVFWNMTDKHCKRIANMEGKHPFYQFFDGKSYMIMAAMMTMGILIRTRHLLSYGFIAYFYTGLSIALIISGLRFLVAWVRYKEENPVTSN